MTSILDDTREYESWLASYAAVDADDLTYKHTRMADPRDPFPFFRGTYYRWLRQFRELCPELNDAPPVLAIGDLHLQNFGTWRDGEGRLAWGVNDFDETADLPYTIDLVRLACSIRFAKRTGTLGIQNGQACDALVRIYKQTLESGGQPFVLEEENPHLRALAYAQERGPARFWKRLTRLLQEPEADVPEEARELLLRDMPAKRLACQFRFHRRVGMGSLGKPRFTVLAQWSGGWVARQAKAIVPPASCWLDGKSGPSRSRMGEIVKKAIRCRDPFFRPEKDWIARRIAPRCSKIELSYVKNSGDQTALIEAMGAETANVHLGSAKVVEAILKDLDQRPKGWLWESAKRMYKVMRADWVEWRCSTEALPAFG